MNPNDIINGRYLLVRSIGRGSFGEVWLAEDTMLGIQVAVKIYIALDSRGLEEFKNEFKNVRHLNHPNLLRPDYYDHSGNSPYLVMTYCPQSVGDMVGKMGERDVWALVRDVSAGLEYLHKMDMVHRDIKPDNILKNDQGVYVISDFGLSQKMRSTLRRASARNNADDGSLSGTVGYMAPEMFSSKPNAVKATDIWALGATIYEVVTGEMPFCGQGGVMELHGAELPDLPSGYGETLSGLMHRCLAKDPWDRPTAKEINEIARMACQDNNRKDLENNAGASTVGQEKYLQEIAKLKEQLASVRKAGDNSDLAGIHLANVIKARKGKRLFKISFWITLALLIVSVLLGLLCIGKLSDEYQTQMANTESQLNEANDLISDIEYICNNGSSGGNLTFSNWSSSNHTHNSRDYEEYAFSGYEGDILSLDYNVDSESFDHFKAMITTNGNTTVLKDISGLNKKGNISYKLPGNGSYILVVEYKKDNSVHSGRDGVQVTDIVLRRSSIGAIAREIALYNEMREMQKEDSDFVEEVEVVPVENWDEIVADTVAADTVVAVATE